MSPTTRPHGTRRRGANDGMGPKGYSENDGTAESAGAMPDDVLPLLYYCTITARAGVVRQIKRALKCYVSRIQPSASPLVVAAVLGFIAWLRARPAPEPFGRPTVRSARVFTAAFVIFVGFLGLYGILAPNGAVGTSGGIFPEVMSDFTLRSFGAFYLALALGATSGEVLRESRERAVPEGQRTALDHPGA